MDTEEEGRFIDMLYYFINIFHHIYQIVKSVSFL